MNLLGCRVDPHPRPPGQRRHRAENRQQGDHADRVVDPVRRSILPSRPATPSQQHDVRVQRHTGQHHEIQHGVRRDHAACEIAKLLGDAHSLGDPLQAAAGDRARAVEEYEHTAKDAAEQEGDRQVIGQQRRRHRHGQQRGSHQPVADVRRNHQPRIGVPQPCQHHDMTQRKQQRHGVDADGSQVLADHDLPVFRRQREQQIFRTLLLFFRPQRHRNRRDEEYQQVREEAVQLVEVREIGREELFLPEGRHRTQEYKQREEHIPGRRRKIADDLAFHDRLDQFHAAASSAFAAALVIARNASSRLA